MSKIVITGGAGFIGSHIVDNLARYGNEITIVDNLDPYYSLDLKKRNIDIILKNENVSFVNLDITNIDNLKEIVDDTVDYVYHEAAQPGVRISIQDPFRPNNINIVGTLNVLKLSLDANVKRVINASSSSVYGTVKYLPFDEEHPTMPISPYGVSKLAAEHYCRVFYHVYGLPTVSLRYFTVYGPRMRPDLAIHKFTKKILNDEPITIFGDGNQTRDFTYIDDIVGANIKLLNTNKADGKVINLGNGNRITVNEMVKLLEDIIGKKAKIIYDEKQKGDAEHTLANIELAKKLIGYEPRTLMREGLEKFVSYEC